LSQNQYISARQHCGPIFANRACRDALGISESVVKGADWSRYLHPEDRQGTLVAWADFLQGKSPRFHRVVRWIRPDTKETVSLAVRAQRLLCGDIQGWLRSAAAEQALSRLEELAHARR
jgi:PAS domain-containing protein